ncbi:MAG TPA: hypothetical protein VID48_06925, partial [Solirubrobacteraceae bacterium]
RLVLLGDVLELRHGPHREALEAARPFFSELGEAFAGREVVIVAGNHDHAILERWLQRRAELPPSGALGLQERIAPAEASWMLEHIARWSEPARVSVAYPGVWVRPDVYATHGHYLDCHMTLPTMECVGIGVMSRLLRRPATGFHRLEDYEAVMGPVFAWIDSVAQLAPETDALNGQSTVRAWMALRGQRDKEGMWPAVRSRLITGAFPVGVALLNRAGVGHFNPDISGAALRRAGLSAMGEVTRRLGLADTYVVFGHTHRAGPLPEDPQIEWSAAGGARLINSGCWTYEPHFLTATPGESPYWPGACVLVEDEGPPTPPVLKRLLADRSHSDLSASAN